MTRHFILTGCLFFFWGLVGYGLSTLFYPYVQRFLKEVSSVQKNYQGIEIPCGTGLNLYFVLLVATTLQWLVCPRLWTSTLIAWMLFGATTVTFIGWVDDVYGSDREKGLKAHFRQFWIEKRLTTGCLKAFGFSMMSGLVAVGVSEGLLATLVNMVVLIFSINTLNLFDLRPGRAMKFFFLMFCLFLPFSRVRDEGMLFFPFLGSLLHLYRYDISAHSMLGDSGANLLGFILGFAVIMTQPQWTKVVLILFFLVLHWFAERHSISDFIRKSRLLKWLDNLGREGNPDRLL